MSDFKLTPEQVQAAQKVVQNGIDQMESLTKQILAQSGASQVAMQAPAGQVTSETYDGIGGAGRALAETLAQLQHDLSTMTAQGLEGSDQATSIARGAASSISSLM